MEETIIEVDQVTFQYHEDDARPALNAVSLSVKKANGLLLSDIMVPANQPLPESSTVLYCRSTAASP